MNQSIAHKLSQYIIVLFFVFYCCHSNHVPRPLQGEQVLRLLRESNVIGHMMCVPPSSRSHPLFQEHYCVLVKALHPVKLRKKVASRETTPPKATPTEAMLTKPPPKPARAHKVRRFTVNGAGKPVS